MRIKDLPEATELADDDYLVLASEGGGACKILAKKLEPVVVSIDAVYTQTETVYNDTPLDDLKTDLVVTAYFEGGGSKEVDSYTLSGTLEVGSSIITVSYKGKTDTIIVEVRASSLVIAEWDFSSNTPLVDKINGYQLTSSGVTFPTVEGEIVASFASYNSYLLIPNEASFRLTGDYTSMSYIIDFKKCNSTNTYAMGYYDEWPNRAYLGCSLQYQHFSSNNRWDFGNKALVNSPSNANYFDNSQITIKFTKGTGNKVIPELYKDGVLVSASQELTSYGFMGRYALGANSDALYMQIRSLKVVVE